MHVARGKEGCLKDGAADYHPLNGGVHPFPSPPNKAGQGKTVSPENVRGFCVGRYKMYKP